MNNFITPAPIETRNTTVIRNGDYSINNVVMTGLKCTDFINDLTKTTFGLPLPGRTVIGICNYGDRYIYMD